MLKKIILIITFAGVMGTLLFGLVNRTGAMTKDLGVVQSPVKQSRALSGYLGNGKSRVRAASVDENGTISNDSTGLGALGSYQRGADSGSNYQYFTPDSGEELSSSDEEALIYMREEEKLAHDVYIAMYEQWGLPLFQNISRSEQAHTDAIKTLLDAYNIPDPASTDPGVFTNPELQALHNQLVTQGKQSLSEALLVGAAIEEIDILDLQESLGVSDNSNIQRVFNNLLRGSINHLKAFTSTFFAETGETYQPQFMSAEELEISLGGSISPGNQGSGMRGYRGGKP